MRLLLLSALVVAVHPRADAGGQVASRSNSRYAALDEAVDPDALRRAAQVAECLRSVLRNSRSLRVARSADRPSSVSDCLRLGGTLKKRVRVEKTIRQQVNSRRRDKCVHRVYVAGDDAAAAAAAATRSGPHGEKIQTPQSADLEQQSRDATAQSAQQVESAAEVQREDGGRTVHRQPERAGSGDWHQVNHQMVGGQQHDHPEEAQSGRVTEGAAGAGDSQQTDRSEGRGDDTEGRSESIRVKGHRSEEEDRVGAIGRHVDGPVADDHKRPEVERPEASAAEHDRKQVAPAQASARLKSRQEDSQADQEPARGDGEQRGASEERDAHDDQSPEHADDPQESAEESDRPADQKPAAKVEEHDGESAEGEGEEAAEPEGKEEDHQSADESEESAEENMDPPNKKPAANIEERDGESAEREDDDAAGAESREEDREGADEPEESAEEHVDPPKEEPTPKVDHHDVEAAEPEGKEEDRQDADESEESAEERGQPAEKKPTAKAGKHEQSAEHEEDDVGEPESGEEDRQGADEPEDSAEEGAQSANRKSGAAGSEEFDADSNEDRSREASAEDHEERDAADEAPDRAEGRISAAGPSGEATVTEATRNPNERPGGRVDDDESAESVEDEVSSEDDPESTDLRNGSDEEETKLAGAARGDHPDDRSAESNESAEERHSVGQDPERLRASAAGHSGAVEQAGEAKMADASQPTRTNFCIAGKLYVAVQGAVAGQCKSCAAFVQCLGSQQAVNGCRPRDSGESADSDEFLAKRTRRRAVAPMVKRLTESDDWRQFLSDDIGIVADEEANEWGRSGKNCYSRFGVSSGCLSPYLCLGHVYP